MTQNAPTAKFSFSNYRFTQFNFFAPSGSEPQDMEIAFSSSGVYNKDQSLFELYLSIKCFTKENVECITANMISYFNFADNGDEVPEYFYTNSIAIVFPYIRAFISTLTLQSNGGVAILPTLNLVHLADELKINTVFK